MISAVTEACQVLWEPQGKDMIWSGGEMSWRLLEHVPQLLTFVGQAGGQWAQEEETDGKDL